MVVPMLKPDPLANTDTPSRLAPELAILLAFGEHFKDVTPKDTRFWEICGRLNRMSDVAVGQICATEVNSICSDTGTLSQPDVPPEPNQTISKLNARQLGNNSGPDSNNCNPMGDRILSTIGYNGQRRSKRPSIFDLSLEELAGQDTTISECSTRNSSVFSGSSTLVSEGSTVNCDIPWPRTPTSKEIEIPELLPVYLSYPDQHILLTSAQSILEQSCHSFIQKWSPSTLLTEGFTHPESAELPKWINLIMHRLPSLSEKSIDTTVLQADDGRTSTIDTLSQSVSQMRHTVVHRLKLPAESLQYMVQNTITFAKFLKDDETRINKLQRILEKLISLSEELENGKATLRGKLKRELGEIGEARAELDKWERLALVKIWADDKTIRGTIKVNIHEVLGEAEPEPDIISVGINTGDVIGKEPEKVNPDRPGKLVPLKRASEAATLSRFMTFTRTRLGNYLSDFGEFCRGALDVGNAKGSINDDNPEGQGSMETFYSQSF
ncbi:hypothetical protein TWF481_005336 [Arthrobotrys musiformis]|uniref:Uncharacterized protein n=1 Tax=Arthrobotrys musiformis TaxID=47236 RepID=A0AAV9WDF7_9PEZI